MKLPTRIGMLTSLQELILSGCSRLVLQANVASTNHLHSTAQSWQSIWSWVSPRKSLESASFSLASLPFSLGRLSLVGCNLSEIPNELSLLSSLKQLDLTRTVILSLPKNMSSLTMLQSLLLDGYPNLRMLPELPPSLQILQASYCTSLKRTTNLPNVFTSLGSSLLSCVKLVEVQGLFTVKPLRSVDKIIKDIGLLDLESLGSTEVVMLNCLTLTHRTGPPQVVYECAIFSIFLHGSKIPNWYSYMVGNSVLSIILTSHPIKLRG